MGGGSRTLSHEMQLLSEDRVLENGRDRLESMQTYKAEPDLEELVFRVVLEDA